MALKALNNYASGCFSNLNAEYDAGSSRYFAANDSQADIQALTQSKI